LYIKVCFTIIFAYSLLYIHCCFVILLLLCSDSSLYNFPISYTTSEFPVKNAKFLFDCTYYNNNWDRISLLLTQFKNSWHFPQSEIPARYLESCSQVGCDTLAVVTRSVPYNYFSKMYLKKCTVPSYSSSSQCLCIDRICKISESFHDFIWTFLIFNCAWFMRLLLFVSDLLLLICCF